jgi:hypothetical protein
MGESLDDTIESTHIYLEEQRNNVDDMQFKCIMASQVRSVRAKIENFMGGVSKDDAGALLEVVRNGPWTGVQINSLSQALDRAVTHHDKAAIHLSDRKPQSCDNVELFWSDQMWSHTLEDAKPRLTRIASIVAFLMSMDLTNPDPKCKQRIVAMLGLGDEWIRSNPTNAKIVLSELTDALKKARPPLSSTTRPHLTIYPKDPASACIAIDGFGFRVYGHDSEPTAMPPYTTADIDDLCRKTVLRWTNKSVRMDAPGAAVCLPFARQPAPNMHASAPFNVNVSTPNMSNQQHMSNPQHMQQMHQAAMANMMQMQMMMMGGGFMQPGMFGGDMPQFGCGSMPPGMFGGGCGMGGGTGWGAGGGGGACAGGCFPGAGAAVGALSGHQRPPAIDVHSGRYRGAAALQNGTVSDGPKDAPPDQDAADAPDAGAQGDELESLEQALANSEHVAKAKPKATAAPKAKAEPKVKAEPKSKVAAKVKAAARPKPQPAAGKGAAGVLKRPAAGGGVPHWGFEESRSQIMCRTGVIGVGQNHAIKYEIVGGKAAAIKLADTWVANKKKELGIKK